MQMVGSGVTTVAGESWDHILLLNDNAANNTVDNTGTDGNDWAAYTVDTALNTSTLHSATAKEGDGSFSFPSNGYNVRSPSAYTSTKFTFQFWVYITNATAAAAEEWCGVWDGVGLRGANEFTVHRAVSTDEITFSCRANSGVNGDISTTDFSPSANTWYSIKVIVDSTATPWTITASWGTDEGSMTALTLSAWSADPDANPIFDDPFLVGTKSTNESEIMVDNFRLKAN